MPATMKIGPNPGYTPTNEDKAVYDEVVRRGVIELDTATAMENIVNAKGLYVVIEQEAEPNTVAPRRLEDMTLDELKIMMLSLGIKTEKQMKRTDVERLIRSRMAEIDIVEDGS